jgi:hypothetical protein
VEFILDEVYDLPNKMQRFLDADHPSRRSPSASTTARSSSIWVDT